VVPLHTDVIGNPDVTAAPGLSLKKSVSKQLLPDFCQKDGDFVEGVVQAEGFYRNVPLVGRVFNHAA
jgi:hypothetical protein